MAHWQRVLLLTPILAPAILAGCLLRAPRTDCRSDKDCKLDRVCEAGRCVWPAAPSKPSASVPPARLPGSPRDPPLPPASATSAPGQAMFRFGPQHRGRSEHRLPKRRPDIIWSYETRGRITSSPAVSGDLVLVGSHDGALHVVQKNSVPAWVFPMGDLVFSSPAVSAAGVVYVGSDDDNLYALDLATREPVWRFQAGSCPRPTGVGPMASRCDVDAGPTIGPDGVIYTGGDAIYAINPNGTLRWRLPTDGHVSSAPALLPDGTVVAGCQDDLVYAVGPNGTKRWDFRTGGDVESSPAVGADGTIYVGSDDHKLYALASDGILKWALATGGDVRASPAIGPDGTIYVGAFDALLYAVRPDGTLAWTFRTGDRVLSSALVDAEGAILVGSQDDRLYALEPDGRHRWSVALGGDVDSSPVLDADGTIYVGADDRKLYALRASAR